MDSSNCAPLMILVAVLTLGYAASADATSGAWLGQQPIVTEDAGDAFSSPSIHCDSNGIAWVFWTARHGSRQGLLEYTHWENGGWSEPLMVDPDASSARNYRLTFAFTENDSIWLAWHLAGSGETRSIRYCRGDGVSWSPLMTLENPGVRLNWAPKIVSGGGEVWLAWYGNNGYVSNSTPDRVFATRWEGEAFAPIAEVSLGLPGDHWFVDLAVDSTGAAHLVWSEYLSGSIYYSTSTDGSNWSTPFVINPPLLGVAGAGWAAPRITLDPDGGVHVAWAGVRILPDGTNEDWDIYYSGYDGAHWTSPLQVNPDDAETDAYPTIQAAGAHDIWIAWFDGNPGSASLDAGCRAVRWDGLRQTGLYTLNDDSYPFNSTPNLALDDMGFPWAVWQTIGPDYSPGAIVYNRYDPAVPVGAGPLRALVVPDGIELAWDVHFDSYVLFRVQIESAEGFRTLAEFPFSGSREYRWVDRAAGAGIRTYRVLAKSRTGSEEVIGPVSIEAGAGPSALTVQIEEVEAPRARVKLTIGLPKAETVTLELLDVRGRLIATRPEFTLPAGWSETMWTIRAQGGRQPAAGVYWVRVKSGELEATARLLLLP